ncbi:MAG: hypothetical protein LBJ59_08490 [Zoogloeaceae bacterium]|jgi:Ca2+/Na+ antiporter|nr:hypothetical protein [Zoogloeaceae bacterium]
MNYKFDYCKDIIILILAVSVMFFILVDSHYLYLYIYGTILAFVVFAPYCYVTYFRWKGVYPKAGSESIKNAILLYENGYKTLAMRCYRKATKARLKETVAYFRNIDSEKH